MSKDDARYFLTIVDDFYSMVLIYFLETSQRFSLGLRQGVLGWRFRRGGRSRFCVLEMV